MRRAPAFGLPLFAASCFVVSLLPSLVSGATATFERWKPRGIPGATVALDPVRHRLVALGHGRDPAEPLVLPLVPGATWGHLGGVGTRPAPADLRSFVFDPAGDRLVVQGGVQTIFGCLSSRHVTDSTTWSLSLGAVPTWTRLGDLPVSGAPLVADTVRQRMLLYGGYFRDDLTYDGMPQYAILVESHDLWALDDATGSWSKLGGGGPDAFEVAALDPVRDRLVVMRRAAPRTVWTYALSGTPGWTTLAPSGIEPATPVDRAEYDPASDALLLFSGDQVVRLTLGSAPEWQAVATTGTGATVRGWDPAGRKAWGYDIGGPVRVLDEGSGWAWSQQAAAIGNDDLVPNRKDHAVAYDGTSHRTFVFGGTAYLCPLVTPFCGCSEVMFPRNDTRFVADPYAGGWAVPDFTADVPSLLRQGAYDMGLVHDPGRNRLVLASGKIYPVSMSTPDVWTLDLNGPSAWTTVTVSGTRPSRPAINAAAWDAAADRALFFGGAAGNDLWAIDFTGTPTWVHVPIVGEPGTTLDFEPSAWDASRRRLWILDPATMQLAGIDVTSGAAWQPVAVAGTPPAPGARCLVTFDEARDRLLVIRDGTAPFLWEIPLANPEWREVSVTGGPAVVLDGASFTFDPFRDRALLFGGGQPSGHGETDALDVVQFAADSATAVTASLLGQDVTPGRVRLVWQLADAAGAVLLAERSTDGVAWTALGTLVPDAGGRVELVDESVVPGVRRAYRLREVEGGEARTVAQVWVQVPAGCALRLDGARPNPVRESLRLSFSLVDGAPATLEVLDVQGRSCARTDVGALGAGEHVLALSPERPLAPGLYFARLVTTRGVRLARFGVVK